MFSVYRKQDLTLRFSGGRNEHVYWKHPEPRSFRRRRRQNSRLPGG